MKRRQWEELREMAPEEIARRLEDSREAYFKLRMQFSTGQLKSTSQLREARRDIARMETLLRQKPSAGAAEGSEA